MRQLVENFAKLEELHEVDPAEGAGLRGDVSLGDGVQVDAVQELDRSADREVRVVDRGHVRVDVAFDRHVLELLGRRPIQRAGVALLVVEDRARPFVHVAVGEAVAHHMGEVPVRESQRLIAQALLLGVGGERIHLVRAFQQVHSVVDGSPTVERAVLERHAIGHALRGRQARLHFLVALVHVHPELAADEIRVHIGAERAGAVVPGILADRLHDLGVVDGDASQTGNVDGGGGRRARDRGHVSVRDDHVGLQLEGEGVGRDGCESERQQRRADRQADSRHDGLLPWLSARLLVEFPPEPVGYNPLLKTSISPAHPIRVTGQLFFDVYVDVVVDLPVTIAVQSLSAAGVRVTRVSDKAHVAELRALPDLHPVRQGEHAAELRSVRGETRRAPKRDGAVILHRGLQGLEGWVRVTGVPEAQKLCPAWLCNWLLALPWPSTGHELSTDCLLAMAANGSVQPGVNGSPPAGAGHVIETAKARVPKVIQIRRRRGVISPPPRPRVGRRLPRG